MVERKKTGLAKAREAVRILLSHSLGDAHSCRTVHLGQAMISLGNLEGMQSSIFASGQSYYILQYSITTVLCASRSTAEHLP